MREYIIALVRVFKEKKWAEEFRQGQLYMNPIEYFIKSEEEQVGDSSEATALVLKYKFDILGKQFNSSLKIRDGDARKNPAFCMYAIYNSNYNKYKKVKLLSNKMKKFGDYAVVVTDVRAFLERIRQNEKRLDYSYIKYIDFNIIKGAIFHPIIKKNNTYKHQNEFRIFSDSIMISSNYSDTEKKKLDFLKFIESDHYNGFIGDISDITSEVVSTDELINGVNLNLNIDWKFCRKSKLDLTTKEKCKRNRGNNFYELERN